MLEAIVRDSKIDGSCNVLEIGAGSGNLTQELVKVAKKVVSYEIDQSLKQSLENRFLNCKNLKLVFGDIMKIDTKQIEKDFDGEYHIVANIPYYITTPILFKFLEEGEKLKSLTIMVQKEVAERICAKPNTEDWGILSVVCQRHCKTEILRKISKKMFYPVPKVDSAIVKLTLIKPFDKQYSTLIRESFAMRRKILFNNLQKAYNFKREELEKVFENLGFNLNVRAEELSLEDFENLYRQVLTLKVN